MAQNISIWGASYSDVPAVELPKTGGGTASFTDVTDTTATASDVASGKYFYTAAGVKTAGTSSGGGGGTVTITDTTDTHGGTIRTITTDPNATVVESLNVTQNGTYTPTSGHAYAPVTVNVSGGGSSYTLLGSQEFTVNTTSTSATSVGTIACGSSAWTSAKFIVVTVQDKAGARSGYFTSSCTWFINYNAKNGSTGSWVVSPTSVLSYNISSYSKSDLTGGSGYGVYASSINDSGVVSITSRYNSSGSRTINGTYLCQVWALDFPTGFNPWGE